MSLEKLKAEAVALRKNIDNVYSAGYAAGKAAGGDSEAAYEEGVAAERKRFWDSIFQDGERTDFKYGFAGISWLREIEYLPYVIQPVDIVANTRSALGMFFYFNRGGDPYDMTEVCKKLDLSRVLSAQQMFNNACVKNVTLDLSNVTTVNGLFNANDGGEIRDTVTLTVSDKCTVYTNAFGSMVHVTQLTFTEGSVIAGSVSFSSSRSLSTESVQSIIDALQDRTGSTALTVTFHTDVVNKMTDEQILQINNKNWQLG